MVGSWYVLVMCEKERLLWTPPLPRNGRKTSKCGGILKKKQSAALTLEARIMNFIVLNPQGIPHRTGPSCQVILGSRLPISTYWLVGPIRRIAIIIACVCLCVCVCVVHPPSAQVLQSNLIKLGHMDHWGT